MNFRNLFARALIATAALFIGTQAFAARTTTYYHNDGLGSVVAATNDAGTVLWRKDYAPFGEQIDTTPDNERQSYTGKSHDDVTGLTYFGGRYYDPQVARFMSVDPVGFVDNNTMSFNRYLYVNNNPYKYVDPDGEFLNFVAKFVLDVGVNIAFNYITTGEMNVGGALKESALGLLNPAKTLAKAGSLVKIMAKTKKVENAAVSGFAAKKLPPMKGMGANQREKVLTDGGFNKTKTSNSAGKNETWSHADGSEVRVHPYGNVKAGPHKSGNNAHLHKQDPAGNQLNDRGVPSADPNATHIGVPNPSNFPAVRGRPSGS